jgi:hypothetical protein
VSLFELEHPELTDTCCIVKQDRAQSDYYEQDSFSHIRSEVGAHVVELGRPAGYHAMGVPWRWVQKRESG